MSRFEDPVIISNSISGAIADRDQYLIDDVIDPRETRPTIIRGLRMAADKKVERPWRKHGVMPV
jgi:acetyl-CoA carboxylase carboxyltransferase component